MLLKSVSILIDELIRSKRRSIALVMAPDARLIVRAPLSTPIEYIERVIKKQQHWIERKRAQILKRKIQPPKRFVDGESFLLLGQSYLFRIQDVSEIDLKSNELIFPRKYLAKAQNYLIRWYKEQAFSVITQIAQRYSQLSGWRYKTINVNSARTRWGSCSTSGSLNFSWRLVFAPREVVEYVVVHELSHITEKNHSDRFWNKVASLMPDYKVHEKWLRDNGRTLTL